MNYEAACKAAATDQGLDPIAEVLTAAKIPFEIRQTGGFVMVATIECMLGEVMITREDGEIEDYLVGVYEADEDGVCHSYHVADFLYGVRDGIETLGGFRS